MTHVKIYLTEWFYRTIAILCISVVIQCNYFTYKTHTPLHINRCNKVHEYKKEYCNNTNLLTHKINHKQL